MLTNCDLDHVLGLFSLREAAGMDVYATPAVRSVAESALGIETVLSAFGNWRWHEPPKDFASFGSSPSGPGLLFRSIELPGKPPPFARNAAAGAHSLAYQFQDPSNGKRLLVAPDVAQVTQELSQALEHSDSILFDGTFWSGDELAAVRPGAAKSLEMGHLTIQDESLELLAKLPARRKIYIHINNTNPILANGSAERAAVEAAGLTVGWDGLEFEL